MFHKFPIQLLAVLGLICLSLSLAACAPKVTIRSIDMSQPTPAPAETIASTTAVETSRVSEATSRKEAATTYDFTQEYDPGNLQARVAVTAQSYGAEENGPGTAALDQLIHSFLQERGLSGSEISIGYMDLTGQQRYLYQGDLRYNAASTIKVGVAMVMAQFMDQGYFPQDLQVAYVPGEHFSADNLDPGRLGQLVPASELINNMLLYSDNAATSVLFEYFNRHGRVLHNFIDECTGTHFAADMTLSAREGLGLMEQLYFDQRFPSYQTILTTMAGSAWQEYLTKGIPVSVSAKYGQLAALHHEIGLVWTDRPFAYAVFSNNIAAYDVLPALGSLLYNYHTGQTAAELPPDDAAPVDPDWPPALPQN